MPKPTRSPKKPMVSATVPFTRRSTDAMKLTFPMQFVIVIITTTLSIAGGYWGMSSKQDKIQSDVRDILTKMDAQAKLQDERMGTMRDTISEMKRRIELQEFAVRAVQATVDKIQIQQQGARR